ncbi:uncharacterized protein ARMOST_04675 [Armillaria ostoyae]|uniref:Uncharacterized protein n=1 Tax=Armillaria ostoyae TaxID=47428 RepID=A0A284QY75_ARMOS|nr:uncharacterized protein ARMOST_04675 [Armillaria ostoyae]
MSGTHRKGSIRVRFYSPKTLLSLSPDMAIDLPVTLVALTAGAYSFLMIDRGHSTNARPISSSKMKLTCAALFPSLGTIFLSYTGLYFRVIGPIAEPFSPATMTTYTPCCRRRQSHVHFSLPVTILDRAFTSFVLRLTNILHCCFYTSRGGEHGRNKT